MLPSHGIRGLRGDKTSDSESISLAVENDEPIAIVEILSSHVNVNIESAQDRVNDVALESVNS